MMLHKWSSGFIVLALLLLTLTMACGGGDGNGGDAATTGGSGTSGSSDNGSTGQTGTSGEAAPAAMAEVGKPAPEFSLTVYENDNFTKDQVVNLSDLRGKPVVINFWFPSCTQCQDLMFLLKDSYGINKDNVHFVAIQVSAESKSEWDPSGSDAASGQDYVTGKELHFIVGGDFDRSIATLYGVDAYPTTYFLDKDLNLVSSAEYLRAAQIKENIELASE
jgi:peroxiredoxin